MLIRLATETDAATIADIYAPAVTDHPTSFEGAAPDEQEMARRIADLRPRYPWLVCEDESGVAGYAYASPHRERLAYQWAVEVSAYVHPRAQRLGIAKGLYDSLFSILALQGFRNVYAGITLPNPASEALHRAVGFNLVGVYRGIGYKHGKWHDVAWFERPLAERVADPPAPRPLSELEGTPSFGAAIAAGQSLLSLSPLPRSR